MTSLNCSQLSSSSIDSSDSMSSRDILSDECQSSPLPTRRHSITTTNASDINSDVDKANIFEIERNIYKKKVQVKTKQEDFIYSTNKSSSPHRVRIHQSNSSPIVNNQLQSIRVSVSSSPYEKEVIQKIETVSPTCSTLRKTNPMKENLPSKEDEENILYRRPLLALLNEENLVNQRRESSNILPAKLLPSFRPVILHKKFQEPVSHSDQLTNTLESISSSPKSLRRNNVIRSHTIPRPTDIIPTFDSITSSNSSLQSSTLSKEDDSKLSTSIASLTSTTFNSQVTPTSSGPTDDKNEARRKAIALQMYDTEKSYVEALKNLVTKYYLPMKNKNIVSNDLINDIFYKIPEIHIHHTAFLISLSQKLSQWDNKQTVGDLLLQMFTRTSVIETYTSFVNNYKTAQIAIGTCRDISSFNKFLEQQARDHRGKLTLGDLIIQPVQRIPRYELYLKDFLKCTNINHPDYQLMLKAQLEIHSLAEQIDQVQKEVGSTELTLTRNSLELVQDIIENLTDLVNDDRYYICHDLITLQSSSGLKKDRCIFLFNDLLLITSCKRKNVTSMRKSTSSLVIDSPSGKQYIENAKYKLIMKISLENVNLAGDQMKKARPSLTTPPLLKKSQSTVSTIFEKHRHFEEDLVTLGQMSDLAKTITIPHQQLDDSIKETVQIVNKHLLEENTTLRKPSPEPNILPDNQSKSTSIQLILNTTDCLETIELIFPSVEQRHSWERHFLEAKRRLFETAAGRRNVNFQRVLTLPHRRRGSQFTCGVVRSCSNDLCLCDSEGEVCLINLQSDLTVKTCNSITSSPITCVAYIPFNQLRSKPNSIKSVHRQQSKTNSSGKVHENSMPADSVLDIDSSDEDEFSIGGSSMNISEDQFSNGPDIGGDDATIWLGTENGGLFIYQCSQTIANVRRKSGMSKQFNSSIHFILYSDNKVFLALNHGQLAVFKRDLNGQWDLDNPIIQLIDEKSQVSNRANGEFYDDDNSEPISVMTIAAGKLWCAIGDRVFVICINSLIVQHSFIVDDCHRRVSSMTTGGSCMHHVWIASQGSHEIRLYHATHFVCLLETSVRTAVTQRLQASDDVIRAHKLGCLYVSTLHVCKETLWIGTSAGVLINLTIPQLFDSLSINGTNKLTSNSVQLKGLTFGHVGPVRFIISTDEGSTGKTFVISIGDGFEDYNNNDETLGKDDALSHLILWEL